MKPNGFLFSSDLAAVGVNEGKGVPDGAAVAVVAGVELFVATGGKPKMLLGGWFSFVASELEVADGKPKTLLCAGCGCLPCSVEAVAGGKRVGVVVVTDDVGRGNVAGFGGEPGGVSLGSSNELIGVVDFCACAGWPKAEKGAC